MKNMQTTSTRSVPILLRATGCLALALALTLSACGGSGGGGGAIFGGGSGSNAGAAAGTGTGAGATAPTLAEQIAALEQSGGYPQLDRSADIAGPDADGNGVRDDVDQWISTQPLSDSQRKALTQKARSLQNTLLVSLDDKAALQSAGEGLAASSRCGMLQFPEYSDFSKLAGKIEAMTANTRQRAERYMQYNAARSGSSTTNPRGNTCEG